MILVPSQPRGVILTLGGTTLDLRSRLILCNHWDGLLGRGPLVGQDQDVPDFIGVEPGPRSPGRLLARLEITVDGTWQPDGTPFTGDLEERRDNMLAALDALYDVIGSAELIDAEVHEDEIYEGQIRVEDPDRPALNYWRADLVPSVSVHRGRLRVAAT